MTFTIPTSLLWWSFGFVAGAATIVALCYWAATKKKGIAIAAAGVARVSPRNGPRGSDELADDLRILNNPDPRRNH